MCLTPISIPNPNYKKQAYYSQFGQGVEVPRHLIPTSEFIEVPCHHCTECRQTYFNSILQRALVESRTSYMYFVTLTYDNKHIPILKLPSGEEIYYFNYTHIQNLFKRLRRHKVLDRDFRYLCVNEYGDTFSRPHAHLLIFIAKSESDHESLPLIYEQTLKKNLIKYFSDNIGTRKNPIYEPLLTPRTRLTSKGLKTNYFVKYVEPYDIHSYNTHDTDQAYIKTIRYLISYVNNGSKFDSTIESILSSYTDPYLIKKLRFILTSRVRYSKGFGFGFHNLKKEYLPIISTRCSGTQLYTSDLFYNLPNTFSEYIDTYDNIVSLNRFLSLNKFARYDNISDFMKNLTTNELFLFSVLLRYFPHYVSTIYRRYFSPPFVSSITYLFHWLHPLSYVRSRILSHDISYSETYQYLRTNLEEALNLGIPYLSFKNEIDGTFTALCPFYKKRIATLDDIQSLFNSLSVNSYEDWKNKFINYKNLSKVAKNVGNITKHLESSDIILPSQKKYINLHQPLEGDTLLYSLYHRTLD